MFDVELAKQILANAEQDGWIDLTDRHPDEDEFNCILEALRIAINTTN